MKSTIVIISTLILCSFALFGCPAGQEGLLWCTECADGYYSPDGDRYCYNCDNSCLICDKTTGKCLKCKEKYYYQSGNCFPCERGVYNKECDNSCETCDRKTGDCLTCKGGYGYDSKTKRCLKCPPGYFSPKSSSIPCIKCPHNTYSKYGSEKCLPCESNCSICDVATGKCLKYLK